MISDIKEHFKTKFGIDAEVLISSPGRINLIGEHTDYNNGFVMPAAIDKVLFMALSKNGGDEISIESLDFNESFTFPHNIREVQHNSWRQYIESVVIILNQSGHDVGGFYSVFGGDIPLGAGLSSSAALNCGLIYGLNDLFGFGLSKIEIAKLAQAAEHLIGLNCGLMDQFAVMYGKKDSFIRLDCRDLKYDLYSSSLEGNNFVLLDTKVKHKLTESAYNDRRKDCENVLAVIQSKHADVKSIRDITMDLLIESKECLEPIPYKRVKFVIEENDRVDASTKALVSQDYKKLGELLNQSHCGLSKEYEVSCIESDFLAQLAQQNENVMGARQMGGGFGGCILCIVKENHEDELIRKAYQAYKSKFDKDLKAYKVSIGDGLKRLN